ncbi:hypothetical protein LSTR_LSTR017198 [Laodelphax striatellus]|uniref:Uncharacterized protein n=1 Tax=Laodelphax striatellus TaxID=195883 RepID=A0A482XGE4_LAOST|nr:hypothetical protein LSTR_LSTR017198 [Laodelphax striatellus]
MQTCLFARGAEVGAGVIETKHPRIPGGEIRQLEVGVALAEAGALAEVAFAVEAGPNRNKAVTPEAAALPFVA